MLTTIQSSDVYITQETLQHIGISHMEQHIDVEEGRVIYRGAEPYEGEYNVTPKAYDEVVLPTSGKTLGADVTVFKVPMRTADIPSGGSTVYIAEVI